MPEGDTIFRAARALDRALAGRVVTAFRTVLAPIARVEDDAPIVGRTVTSVESRGKWCLIHLSPPPAEPAREPLILVTHMLMSGSWHIYRTGERWRMPQRAMRVMLRVESASTAEGVPDRGFEAVAFNVPIVEFHTPRSLARSTQVPRLGPDILSADFTQDAGIARLTRFAQENPGAEVGVTLLNQRVLAGLGNVYKSEVAFAAGVNPWRGVGSLTTAEVGRLVQFSERYMKANVADGAGDAIVTYTGNRRTTHRMDREERLWVYRRQGQECRRCGTLVRMRKQGTQARSTYWCPQCQPWLDENLAAPEGNAYPVRRRRTSC